LKLRKNLENKFHMKLDAAKLEENYLKRFKIQVESKTD